MSDTDEISTEPMVLAQPPTPVGLGVAAVLTIIVSLGMLVVGLGWFQHSQLEGQRELHGNRMTKIESINSEQHDEMAVDNLRELEDAKEISGLVKEVENLRVRNTELRTELIEMRHWMEEHDLRVRDINSTQVTNDADHERRLQRLEDLRDLEQYGKPLQ